MPSVTNSISAVQSIKPTDSHAWIDGKSYRITRLPANRYVNNLPPKPNANSKANRILAEKVSSMDEQKALAIVASHLQKQRDAEVKKAHHIRLTKQVREQYADELKVPEGEIYAEYRRLLSLTSSDNI